MRQFALCTLTLAAVLTGPLAFADEKKAAEPPATEDKEAGKTAKSLVGTKDEAPLAGWNNGVFFLRDANDNFQLFPLGRVNVDHYNYMGQGVGSTNLKSTFLLRRLRAELAANLGKRFSFYISTDMAPSQVDNRAAPGKNGAAGSGETAKTVASIVDGYVTYRALPGTAFTTLNLQLGQFDGPFTMENRTSDKFIPFMERSLPVRVVGQPNNKELGAMLWGEFKNKMVGYQVGVFNAPGPNRLDTDGQPDFMGRVYVRPLATSGVGKGGFAKGLSDLQIGASFKYGKRDAKFDHYDYPGMTTQGGFQFWSPTYTAANKQTIRILPSDAQMGVAAELRIPFWKFDLRSELVYIKNNTREAYDGSTTTNTERLGEMKGLAYYVQLGFFAIGDGAFLGAPGYSDTPKLNFKLDPPKEPKPALQFVAKWEQIKLKYDSASRGGTRDDKNIDGEINVNAVSLGANLWVTRHVRVATNYIYNMMPDSAPPGTANAQNRAFAPGNTLPAGTNEDARKDAHGVHELLFRIAFQL